MSLVKMSPENVEVANSYLAEGSISKVAAALSISEQEVTEALNKREVKSYIDTVYLDQGYRNRFRLGELLDTIIEQKLRDAEDTEVFSNKDLADLIHLAHKMRMDEINAMTALEKARSSNIKSQTNVQINDAGFNASNYGRLMERLIAGDEG